MYASKAPGGDWDILRYRIGAAPGTTQTIAGGPGDQDQPDVNGSNVVYRGPEGIWIKNWDVPAPLRTPHAPAAGETQACPFDAPVSNPAIGAQVAAWECGLEGSRDIAVYWFGLVPEEYRLVRPGTDGAGDQHAPAAFDRYVAFVDDSDGGSVWMHDSSPASRGTTFVCDGRASGVAIGSLSATRIVLAVARASQGHDEDVEIWDASGLVTALRVDGVQQNPHVSDGWVAFEDLSTGRSQVVLWQWTTGLVFVPHPSTSNQTLNDVHAGATYVRVVFADDGDGTGVARDIALYDLAFENGQVPDDGTGDSGWPWPPPAAQRPPPASCDDDDPVVLATLVLGRDTGRPLAGSVDLAATPFPGDAVLPVLVCIDADRVSAAWVALDDQAVAMPGDFDPHVTRLQIAAVAEGGEARISGVVAGRPGTSLVARVLADPGRIQGGLTLRRVPAAALSLGGGCGTGGGAGSLAVVAVLAALRRLRRR